MLRRGCGLGCLGCLLPLLIVLALLLIGAHLVTSSPGYQSVAPASSSDLELAAASAVGKALEEGRPVAVIALTDADATALLRDSVGSYRGLSDLQVHALAGRVVVTGRAEIDHHPVVVSGTVRLSKIQGSVVTLKYTGLEVGQLQLPPPIPALITKTMDPKFNLGELSIEHLLTFSCERSTPNRLLVGVSLSSTSSAADRAACSETQ